MDICRIHALMPHRVAFSAPQSVHLVEPDAVSATPGDILDLLHLVLDPTSKNSVLGVMGTHSLVDPEQMQAM